jgi:hypothetical protein
MIVVWKNMLYFCIAVVKRYKYEGPRTQPQNILMKEAILAVLFGKF